MSLQVAKFDSGVTGNLADKFSFSRPHATRDPLGNDVSANEPRYDRARGIADAAPFADLTASPVASADDDQAFGGYDADGQTPMMVLHAKTSQRLRIVKGDDWSTVFSQNMVDGSGSADMMRGAVSGYRFPLVTGIVAHGLILTLCVRINTSTGSTESVAIVWSGDDGANWQVQQDTEGNNGLPDHEVGNVNGRGADFSLQNYWIEPGTDPTNPLAIWVAWCAYYPGPNKLGGQSAMFRCTRDSVGGSWTVKDSRLMWSTDSNDDPDHHYHVAYPVVDLSRNLIGCVTAVGDVADDNRLSFAYIDDAADPDDYLTNTIKINDAYCGDRDVNVTGRLAGPQPTGFAPTGTTGEAFAATDVGQNYIYKVLAPRAGATLSSTKVGLEAVYGHSRLRPEVFHIICREPGHGRGYLAGGRDLDGNRKRLIYSEDGEAWDEVMIPEGTDAPFRVEVAWYGRTPCLLMQDGLHTFRLPRIRKARPMLLGPGKHNYAGGNWSQYTNVRGISSGNSVTKVSANGSGNYEYPTGHERAGEELPMQPPHPTAPVYHVEGSGEYLNCGDWLVTLNGGGLTGTRWNGMLVAVFPLQDRQGWQLFDYSGSQRPAMEFSFADFEENQRWRMIHYGWRNVVDNYYGILRINSRGPDGFGLGPQECFIQILGCWPEGSSNAFGGHVPYPIPENTDASGDPEKASIDGVALGATWSVRGGFGMLDIEPDQHDGFDTTAYPLTIYADANNYVEVSINTDNTLTLNVVSGGVSTTASTSALRLHSDASVRIAVTRLGNGSTELRATALGETVTATAASEITASNVDIRLSNNDQTDVPGIRVFDVMVEDGRQLTSSQRERLTEYGTWFDQRESPRRLETV